MNKFIAIFCIFFVFSGLFLFFKFAHAQPSDSADAIAIRVIPNLEHYSAKRWYIEQKFGGSPQSLEVDGYEAVRDGRSVYVNAGNAIGSELYTNIYLISYNQSASRPTQDIFSQILNNWQFNTNLISPGNCSQTAAKSCQIDSDCPVGEYCESAKAMVVHDVRRMADLSDIETALKNYYRQNGSYPQLQGGTYLKGNTISTWPSWTKILARELAISIPVDPVNQMGSCPGYHPLTCWDEVNKRFDGTLPDGMPTGSRVYAYQARDGEYELCAQMETGYSNIGAYACFDDSAANNRPEITGGGFPPATPGEEYRGFVRAIDPDGDALTWTFSTSGFGGWSGGLTMEPSSDKNQKRFYSALAGSSGGTVNVTVTDSRGLSTSTSYTVVVQGEVVPVVSAISDKNILIGTSLDFTINATEGSGQYPLTYEFSGAPHGLNANGSLDADLHTLHVSGVIIDETREYNVSVVARDSAGEASNPAAFKITVNNNPPNITSSPVTSAEGCSEYNYQIIANEPDGHKMDFRVEGLPKGLSFDDKSGLISGEPLVESASGPFPIKITINDEYVDKSVPVSKGQAIQTYNLNITSESFSVTAPGDQSVYVTPLVPPLGYVPTLYHQPVSPFSQYASKSTANEVTWRVVSTPSLLQDDAYVAIDVDGEIHTGAFKNENFSSSGYAFTAQVTATTNFCNISASGSYNITIYPNEWCGDSATQTNFGEDCDKGSANGNVCTANYGGSCSFCGIGCKNMVVTGPYCGDGFLQAEEGEICDDGNNENNDGCNAGCATEYCGDGIKQTGEECDTTVPPSVACFDYGFDQGTLFCTAACAIDTTNCCHSVDGGWSGWSGWSDPAGYSDGAGGTCSAACDGGTQTRTRTCTDPEPSCGGIYCADDAEGGDTQSQNCNPQVCCTDLCTSGTTRCSGTDLRQECRDTNADGCTDAWVTIQDCGDGWSEVCCDGGASCGTNNCVWISCGTCSICGVSVNKGACPPGPGGTTPYLFTLSDQGFIIENDILNTYFSDLDVTAKTAYENDIKDLKYLPQDIYKLVIKPANNNGKFTLRIKEIEPEESHLDRIKLIKMIHHSNNFAFYDNNEIYAADVNEVKPESCIDENGKDCLKEIESNDSLVLRKYAEGYAVVRFKVESSDGENYLAITSWENHFIPSMINLPFGEGYSTPSLHIYYYDNGDWKRTGKDFHPRAVINTEYDYIDLKNMVSDDNYVTLKIVWTDTHSFDKLAIVNTTRKDYKDEILRLDNAVHSRYGDITSALVDKDFEYGHIVRGDLINMEFDAGDLWPEASETADYFVIIEGYYHGLRTYLYPEIDTSDSYIQEVNSYINVLNRYLGKSNTVCQSYYDISPLSWWCR